MTKIKTRAQSVLEMRDQFESSMEEWRQKESRGKDAGDIERGMELTAAKVRFELAMAELSMKSGTLTLASITS